MDFKQLKEYLYNCDHFIKDIGIEIDSISEGYAKVRLEHNERHRNANGVVNGGALYTLADFAGVCAASSYGNRITTLNSSINYLSAVTPKDKVFAIARTNKHGNRIIDIDVKVTDDAGKIFIQCDLIFYNLGTKLEFEN